MTKPESRSGKPKRGAAARTPFQLELIRLIEAHADELGTTSGRSLSARLGKSSNHLWQILNRGMVPSGPAILDLAKLLGLSDGETETLIFKAIETKVGARSRDRFWITQARDMVARRDEFLREKGLDQAFSDWEASRRGRTKAHKHGSVPAK